MKMNIFQIIVSIIFFAPYDIGMSINHFSYEVFFLMSIIPSMNIKFLKYDEWFHQIKSRNQDTI